MILVFERSKPRYMTRAVAEGLSKEHQQLIIDYTYAIVKEHIQLEIRFKNLSKHTIRGEMLNEIS